MNIVLQLSVKIPAWEYNKPGFKELIDMESEVELVKRQETDKDYRVHRLASIKGKFYKLSELPHSTTSDTYFIYSLEQLKYRHS